MLIRQINKSSLLLIVFGFTIAVVSGIILFQSMTWGPWAYNDSAAYVSAARNIADGKGPVIIHTTGKIKQLTEFPPFFPFFLSIFGGSNGNYIQIAKWENAILFSGSIFLFSLIIFKCSNDFLLTIFSTFIFISFFPIVEIFSGAMSEPLFIFIFFLNLLLLFKYFVSGQKISILLLLALFSAILPITRYAGILFVGIFGISIFIFKNKIKIKESTIRTIFFFIISLTPIIIWAISLLINFGKFAGKNFSFSFEIFRSLLNSALVIFKVVTYWIPYYSQYESSSLGVILAILGTFLFLIAIFYPFYSYFIKQNKQDRNFFFMSINLGIIGYIFLIAFMHTTSSPQIDIINRTLLPLFPLMIISIIYLISNMMNGITNKFSISKIVVLIIALLSIRYNLSSSIPYIQYFKENGAGFTSKSLQQSEIVAEVEEIPNDKILISNLSGYILFHTNRYPIFVENFPHYKFGKGNTYGEKEFREKGAALILLKNDFYNYYGPIADRLYSQLTASLNVSFEDNEGAIYYFD